MNCKNIKIKRILSFLLVFVMILTVFAQPVTFASGTNSDAKFLSDAQKQALDEMLKSERRSGLVGFTGEYDLNKRSDEKISVIVEFVNQPAVLAQMLNEHSGKRARFENVENAAVEDHVAFNEGLLEIFGSMSYYSKSEMPYEITAEYFNAINGVAIKLPASTIEELSKLDCVQAIYPDVKVKKLDDSKTTYTASGSQIGMADSREYLKIDALHDQGITGEGITIGIIDTGIDYNHPDFEGAFGEKDGKTFYGRNYVSDPDIDKIFPRDALDPMETTYEEWNALPDAVKAYRPILDEYGSEFFTSHGTHVAGTALARPNNSIHSTMGIAPDSTLISYRVLGAYGSGDMSYTLSALDVVNEDGCDVINLSLGIEQDDPYFISAIAINNMILQYDIVFAIASGNSGYNMDTEQILMETVGAPGIASLAITVGNGTVTNYDGVITASASVTSGSAITSTAISTESVFEEGGEENEDIENNNFNLYPLYNHWDSKTVLNDDGTYRIIYENLKFDDENMGYKLISTKPVVNPDEEFSTPPIGTGAEEEFTEETEKSLEGNILVVYRGNILTDTMEKAKECKAGAVIVINDEDWKYWQIQDFRGYGLDYLPMYTMSNEDGLNLIERMKNGDVYLSMNELSDFEGGKLNSTSSRGPVPKTAELKPDVIAPGTEIISTVPYFAANYKLSATDENRYDYAYLSMTGTSMASPHVAGIAALMLQYSIENEGEKWSAQEVKSRLQNTAKPLNADYSVFEVGSGYVDPCAAIEADLTVKVPYKVAIPDENGTEINDTLDKFSFVDGELSSLSFGFTDFEVEMKKELPFIIKSQSDTEKTYDITAEFDVGGENVAYPDLELANITLSDDTITLPAGSEAELSAEIFISAEAGEPWNKFMSFGGNIILTDTEDGEVYRIPFASGVFKEPDHIGMAVLERPVLGVVNPETGEDNRQIKEKTYGVASDYSDFAFGIGKEADELYFVITDAEGTPIGELGKGFDISYVNARDWTEYGEYRFTSLIEGKYYPYDDNGNILDEAVGFEPGFHSLVVCVVLGDELVEEYSLTFYADGDVPELTFNNATGQTITYSDDTTRIEGTIFDEGMQILSDSGTPYGQAATAIMYKVTGSDTYYETGYPSPEGRFYFDIPKEYVGQDIEITFYAADAWTESIVSMFGGDKEANPFIPSNRKLNDHLTTAEFGANMTTYVYQFVYQP